MWLKAIIVKRWNAAKTEHPWISNCLQASLVAIQLHLDLVQFLNLLMVPLGFVAYQRAVEVDGEHHKDKSDRHHDDGGGQGRLKSAVPRLNHRGATVLLQGCDNCCGLRPRVNRQEFDPAEKHHFRQEQQNSQGGGKAPGELDIVVHPFVGRFGDGVEIVNVADSFDVGQDAGTDEESEEVDGHKYCGTDAESNEKEARVVVLHFQLHLYHGHLVKHLSLKMVKHLPFTFSIF